MTASAPAAASGVNAPDATRRAAHHTRLERIVRVVRIIAAALVLGFGSLIPNIGEPFVIVLGVFLAGYGVIVSVLWLRARTPDAIEWASHMTLAADISVVGFAQLVFARDPGWTVYAVGFLIIATGGLRFRNGAILAAVSLSLTYIVVAIFRMTSLGIEIGVGQFGVQLASYLVGGLVLNMVLPEIDTLRTREADLYEPVLKAQEDMGQALLITEDGRAVFWNKALEAMSGLSAERLRAIDGIADLLVADPVALREPGQSTFGGELIGADGRHVPVEVSCRASGERKRDRRVWIFHEARREAAQEADDAPMHDRLTGLPNAPLLRERIAEALPWAERKDRPMSLLVIDLDGFAGLNESFGRRIGDRVLAEIGARLLRAIRESDTAARLGDDSFVALLLDFSAPAAEEVARGLLRTISAPIGVDGEVISVGAKIGIAVYPRDGRDPDTLLARAQSAVDDAKRTGASWRTLAATSEPASGANR